MHKPKGSKKEYLQKIARLYQKSGQPMPATSRMIAKWAMSKGFWEQPARDEEGLLAKELSEAMRDEFFTDPQGRRVRLNHVCHKEEKKPDGSIAQLDLWGGFDHFSRDQMQLSFLHRRGQVLGDCRQLKTDQDSYNENNNKEERIQLCFDFSEDLAELEQPTEFVATKN